MYKSEKSYIKAVILKVAMGIHVTIKAAAIKSLTFDGI